jgi:hypothetical protein
VVELELDMKYQSSLASPISIADVILEQNKETKTVLDKVNFIANQSEYLLHVFMFTDIGDLVMLKDDQYGIDSYFNVHGISYKIDAGGIVRFSWIVKESTAQSISYWFLEVPGKSELGISTILGY